MALSDDDVRELLRIIDESDLAELRIETSDFSLHVRKGEAGGDAASSPTRASTGGEEVASPPAGDRTEQEEVAPQNGLVTITAPMLGTFYRAEGPGQDPFVEPGSKVEPDTTVCIIEVMKMMNSVPAGISGTVVDVCQQNAELVEYGDPLFRVQPE
jgi:acetyl-CoA carboxylase biotin carboxyl carrier protein